MDFKGIISSKFNKEIVVLTSSPVGGGCINECVKLQTNIGIFFAKWNGAKRFPGMMEAEAKGLELLRSARAIRIPEVIRVGEEGGNQYLVLEWMESKGRNRDFWWKFGVGLAQLHKNTTSAFGLDHDNYIGSLPQRNRQHSSWEDFFIRERLEPMVRLARNDQRIGSSASKAFDRFFSKVGALFPKEPPALLHGDLWSGNFLETGGDPVLVDPAVYYGHREVDLAMTRLFGGFPPELYESYHREYQLENGWERRLDLYNLYPLMVHVNLFGGSYWNQAEAILKQF